MPESPSPASLRSEVINQPPEAYSIDIDSSEGEIADIDILLQMALGKHRKQRTRRCSEQRRGVGHADLVTIDQEGGKRRCRRECAAQACVPVELHDCFSLFADRCPQDSTPKPDTPKADAIGAIDRRPRCL